MTQLLEGHYKETKGSLAIVISRFNETITQRLLEGALDTLKRHGIPENKLTIAWAPGAFEIPLVAKRLAETHSYQAIICLGAIIRGATPHFDYVSGPVASQISTLSTKTNLPVIYGILTTDTLEQALERSGIKHGNKGAEAALAAIEMVDLLEKIPVSTHRTHPLDFSSALTTNKA